MVDPVHAIESGDLFAVASFLGAADGNRYWVDRSGRTALWLYILLELLQGERG